MRKLIEKLFGTNNGQKRTDARKLRLESLEDRQMLDAAGFDVAEAGTLLGKPKPKPDPDPTPVIIQDYDVDPRAEFSQALQNIFNGLKADGSEVLEGDGGVENIAIVVTTDHDGMMHSNDFNADGYGNITLRESFDYVGKYFDADAFDNAGKPWEQFTSYLKTTPVENGLYFTHVEMHDNAALTSQIAVSGFDAANPCLVDGQAHTISAATTRAFSVSAQGFTVENATISGGLFNANDVDATASDAGQGNAIYVAANAQATFNNVTFADTANAAKPQPVVKHNGGAIYNLGSVALVGGSFETLTAENGGAVYNKGVLTIDGTVFSANEATNGYGGAIYNAGTLTVESATFERNAAFLGGAIYNSASGVANIGSEEGSVVFNFNTVSFKSLQDETCGSGGAIYNSYSSSTHNAGQLTIQNARFVDNYAPKFGGAIANYGTLTVDASRFNNNIAGIGGAICNAGTATVANSNFTSNKAFNQEDTIDVYSAGGMGGAIYSANNGTASREASLTLTGKINFTENYANRAGAGLDVVSGTVAFDYADGGKFQFLRNTSPYGLGGAICLAVKSDAVSFNGGDRTPTEGFYFNNNKASFANTIGSATKSIDSQSLIENFGFNYANVRASQYDTFVRFYEGNFMDHKFSVDYIASLYDFGTPAHSITFWYGENKGGARKEVTCILGQNEFVTLAKLGIQPQNKPGVYKVEFYYDNNPTCFELLLDTTRNNDIAIRRVDNQQLNGARSFSMISSMYPIDYIVTNWGDGSDSETTPVGGFCATATHFFEPKVGTPEGAQAAEDGFVNISVTVHYMNGTSHDFTFAYNLTPESKKDWRLNKDSDARSEEAEYKALLDVAFAEEEQFDLFEEVQL